MVENKLVIPDEMMQYLNQSILGIEATELPQADHRATNTTNTEDVKHKPNTTETKETEHKEGDREKEAKKKESKEAGDETTAANDDKVATVAKETETDEKDEDSDKNKDKKKEVKKDDGVFKEPLPTVSKDSKANKEVKVKDVLAMSIGAEHKNNEEIAMSVSLGDSGINALEKLKKAADAQKGNETYPMMPPNGSPMGQVKCQNQNLMSSQGRMTQMGPPNGYNVYGMNQNQSSHNIQAMQNMIAGQNMQMQHNAMMQQQMAMMNNHQAMMNRNSMMMNQQKQMNTYQNMVMSPQQQLMMQQGMPSPQQNMMMNQNMMSPHNNGNMNVMSPQNNMNMNVMSPHSNMSVMSPHSNMNVMSPQNNNMNIMSPQHNMNMNVMSPQNNMNMNVMSPQTNSMNMNVMSPQSNMNMNVMSPQMARNVMSPPSNMNVMSPQNINMNVRSPQVNTNVMGQNNMNIMSPQNNNMNVMSPPGNNNVMSPPGISSDINILPTKKMSNQTNPKTPQPNLQQYMNPPNQIAQNCNVPYPNGPMASQLAMHNRLMQYQMQNSTNPGLPKSAASSMSIDQSIGSNANLRSHHESMHQYSNMTLCERHYQDCRGASIQQTTNVNNSQTFANNQLTRANYPNLQQQNTNLQQSAKNPHQQQDANNCNNEKNPVNNYNANFCGGNQWDYQRQNNVYQNYNQYEMVYQNQQRFADGDNGHITRITCPQTRTENTPCQERNDAANTVNGNPNSNNELVPNGDDVQVWDISQSQGSPARNGARQEAYRRTLAYVQSCQGWTNPETVSSSTHPLCSSNSNMVVNDLNTSLSSFYEENQFLQMIQ